MDILRLAKLYHNINAYQETKRKMKEEEEKAKQVKYCVECGAQFKSGLDLFCPKCGAKDPILKQEKLDKWKQLPKKILENVISILILVVIAVFILRHYAVQQVKESTPENYPDLTMAEAFDAYFEHPKWSYDEFCWDYNVIRFTGRCLYLGEEVTAEFEIWSYVNSERASVHSLEFNDVPQEEWMLNLLLLDVYESYAED